MYIDVKDVGYVIVSSCFFIFILRIDQPVIFSPELRFPKQLRRLYPSHWPYGGKFHLQLFHMS